MKTLFLGAYGFGNLGAELVLAEAINFFPSTKIAVRSVSENFTSKCIKADEFIDWEPVCPKKRYKIEFDCVVLGGGGILGGLGGNHYMSWIVAAQNSGAKTYVHNVGVTGGNDDSWITPEIRSAFKRLNGFSVRDKRSLVILKNWGIDRSITVTDFVEKNVVKDMSIAGFLPDKNILGISVVNGSRFFDPIIKDRERITKLISQYKGMKILPIVSTVHAFSDEENDIEGFKKFQNMFLKGFEVLLPETLDKKWWEDNMTPQKLKGLISRCDALISRRKLNCVHSISSGVKTIGLSSKGDWGVGSVFDALSSMLPSGSELILLPNP